MSTLHYFHPSLEVLEDRLVPQAALPGDWTRVPQDIALLNQSQQLLIAIADTLIALRSNPAANPGTVTAFRNATNTIVSSIGQITDQAVSDLQAFRGIIGIQEELTDAGLSNSPNAVQWVNADHMALGQIQYAEIIHSLALFLSSQVSAALS